MSETRKRYSSAFKFLSSAFVIDRKTWVFSRNRWWTWVTVHGVL